MKLQIKKLNPNAKMPTRGTEEAACFDLYVSEDTILPHNEGVLVPTGLAFGIPVGYCVKIYLRSSMCKRGIIGSTGVVDSDYTGEVKVQAVNVGHALPIVLHKGERIGQIKFDKVIPMELEWATELRETARGTGGYGSTGR